MNGCLTFIQPDFSEEEITDIVKHIYTTQADSFNKIPYTEKKSPVEIQPEVKTEKRLDESSFLGTDGKFYIPNPIQLSKITVYENTDAFNKRSQLPIYLDKEQAEKLFLKYLPIDLESLQITEF